MTDTPFVAHVVDFPVIYAQIAEGPEAPGSFFSPTFSWAFPVLCLIVVVFGYLVLRK